MVDGNKIHGAELRRGLTETESLSLFIAQDEGLLQGRAGDVSSTAPRAAVGRIDCS